MFWEPYGTGARNRHEPSHHGVDERGPDGRIDSAMIHYERHNVKRLGLLVSFAIGCAILVAAFGIGWANWGKLANQEVVMQTLMGALAVVVVLLAAMGVLSKGKER